MSWSQPVETYLDDLGAPTPAPGGGASSALAGAVGAAQLQMVVALTRANPRYAGVAGRMAELEAALAADRARFLALADEDAEAYGRVARALKLPRATAAERAARSEELAAALLGATGAPFAIMDLAVACLSLCGEVARTGTSMAASDVTVAAALLRAAVDGSVATVLANTRWMADRGLAAGLVARADANRGEGERLAASAIRRAEEDLR